MPSDELARAIADAALLRGHFTLRSGRTSGYYLDKYRFTTRPDLLRPLAERFATRVRAIDEDARARDGGGVDRLAGAELGGVPLATAVGLATDLPFVLVRNAKKDYGTANRLEGALENGERVVLLEDVATTGGQAVEAIAALRDAGAEVLAVICAIDREEGARKAIEAAGCAFEAIFTKTDLGAGE